VPFDRKCSVHLILRNTKLESKKHYSSQRKGETAILPPTHPRGYANLTDLLLSKNHKRGLIRSNYDCRNDLTWIFHRRERGERGAKILHKSFNRYTTLRSSASLQSTRQSGRQSIIGVNPRNPWLNTQAKRAHKKREAGCLETGFRVCLPAAKCRLLHLTAGGTMANTPVCTRSIFSIQKTPGQVNRKEPGIL
jgi:hypothetical protein